MDMIKMARPSPAERFKIHFLDQLNKAKGIDFKDAFPRAGLVSGERQHGIQSEFLQADEICFDGLRIVILACDMRNDVQAGP